MTRGSRIAVAAIAAYALLHAGVAVRRSVSPRANPHAFMKDPARCGECHLEPIPGKERPYSLMNFRKDIYTLCTACHAHRVSHPVDIAPGQGMSKDLPLDPDGTMTCITCHAPHSAHEGKRIHTGRSIAEKLGDTVFPLSPAGRRTFFLRIPSPRGELCEACHARKPFSASKPVAVADPAAYAGSAACAKCHPREHAAWRASPHARMVRSPRRHPEAVLARFDADPPFPSSEIAYVLGNRNVQRFVSRKGENLVVRTPIWLIRAGTWNLSYWREMDWLKACAGCHTTGYDPFAGRYAEESVACEACHGPGRAHAAIGRPGGIVNPRKLSAERRAMICESCHTTGHDATGEFRFPVGFVPGEDLARFYFGLTPKPGQDDATFRGDGGYADRHAQFLFWRSRMLIVEGETCDLCKNFRMARKEGSSGGPRKMTAEDFCRSCHDGTVVPPPSRHEGAGSRGGRCLGCHPPERNAAGEVSIHDHRYIPPEALAKNDFIPPPDLRSICFVCHPLPAKGANVR